MNMTTFWRDTPENDDLFMKKSWGLQLFQEKVLKITSFSRKSPEDYILFTKKSWKLRLVSRKRRKNGDLITNKSLELHLLHTTIGENYNFFKKKSSKWRLVHGNIMKMTTSPWEKHENNDLFTRKSWKHLWFHIKLKIRTFFMKMSWKCQLFHLESWEWQPFQESFINYDFCTMKS